MKIYIAGQITGLPLDEARENFAEAEAKLKAMGYETVNPMNLERYHPDKEWIDYMIESLQLLRDCDGIYLMDNYFLSNGAQIERLAAISMKKKFFNRYGCDNKEFAVFTSNESREL